MDAHTPEISSGELSQREKRTLRAALDASPARPDAKSSRANDSSVELASLEATEEQNPDVTFFTRFAAHVHMTSRARATRGWMVH